jgi:NADH-quinone oxidoreductase subunit J
MRDILFFLFSLVALIGSLGVLLSKRVITAILLLALNFIGIGIIYILLDATFLGIVQILIYGGAVIVLFLFFLMLVPVDVPKEDLDLSPKGFLTTLLLLFLLLGLILAVKGLSKISPKIPHGDTENLGRLLMGKFLLPFELVSLILLVALITAFLFAKKRVR